MDLNVRLLILDKDQEHATRLSESFMPVVPFVHCDVVSNVQEALQAHLENPYNVSIITQSICETDSRMFLQDMKILYTKNQDCLCAFIQVLPSLPPNFNQSKDNPLGFSAICSEAFDARDQKVIKAALKDYIKFKSMNEHLSDIEWTMQMILSEVDRVSVDRKRGRMTKFNTIAMDFASDLVELDTKVMDKYFSCLSDHAENVKPPRAQTVKIPKKVLEKNLPKLVEDRYTGASSRVWNKLVKKFGVPDKEG